MLETTLVFVFLNSSPLGKEVKHLIKGEKERKKTRERQRRRKGGRIRRIK